MSIQSEKWINHWFNSDYLHLYSNRNSEEAVRQVEFLTGYLSLQGNESILDIGCGRGRHSVLFAERGHPVVGIDQSEELIALASKMINPSLNLQFIQGDICFLEKFNLPLFDLVVCLFTSFGYFEEDNENLKVLQNVRKSLKPSGRFVLDYLHPHHVISTLIPFEEKFVQGEKVEIRREIIGQRVIKTIDFPGRQYIEKVTLYSKDEVICLLNQAGFTVESLINDYEGNPWSKNGNRQIFITKLKSE